jgi:hypothetical protein
MAFSNDYGGGSNFLPSINFSSVAQQAGGNIGNLSHSYSLGDIVPAGQLSMKCKNSSNDTSL